jgi:hypothetical protein
MRLDSEPPHEASARDGGPYSLRRARPLRPPQGARTRRAPSDGAARAG